MNSSPVSVTKGTLALDMCFLIYRNKNMTCSKTVILAHHYSSTGSNRIVGGFRLLAFALAGLVGLPAASTREPSETSWSEASEARTLFGSGADRSRPVFGVDALERLRDNLGSVLDTWTRQPDGLSIPTPGVVVAGNARSQESESSPETASRPTTGPISGYMDFHFNDRQNEDPILDFHRFVLLFSHSFSDRIRFVAELELEHAVVSNETDGELELEQAYVDFLISRPFNLRAGMVLAPVGIINERHEPPVFHGVERPFVDTVIIPTTWFDAGVGVHGEFGPGLRYRAYAMAPLDAIGFSADEGLRDGRQKGAESNARRLAGTGRLEYVGSPGLVLRYQHLEWGHGLQRAALRHECDAG